MINNGENSTGDVSDLVELGSVVVEERKVEEIFTRSLAGVDLARTKQSRKKCKYTPRKLLQHRIL